MYATNFVIENIVFKLVTNFRETNNALNLIKQIKILLIGLNITMYSIYVIYNSVVTVEYLFENISIYYQLYTRIKDDIKTIKVFSTSLSSPLYIINIRAIILAHLVCTFKEC